ncbi:hypothetical protein PsYK624_127870 [Phanerochaete sordida]|uniref:Ubiquitin-like domain-containing protein n=1 Tax=Phanerochaete sordida TaxID=48140 RepID=A0A9P3GIL3_9APHY|nr:hypothetical protein PsYK624_127870 [Phanerochaete sordida]
MALTNSFMAMRMTEDAYVTYKQSLGTAPSTPAGRRLAPSTIRVTGYNQEAKDTIVACNDDGSDFIETAWDLHDTVKRIMQRINDKLRIPLNFWSLAGQGQVLDEGQLASLHEMFRPSTSSGIIELQLVTNEALDDYEEEHSSGLERYVWRHLEVGQTDATDPKEIVRATYNLPDLVDAAEWQAYLDQRKAAEAALNVMLRPYNIIEIEYLVKKIRGGVEDIVKEFDLDETEQFAIADCVVPLKIEVEDDGDSPEPRSATVFTRIYSPTRPAAVDVWLSYNHRSRYDYVEFTSSVLFRVVNPLTDGALPPTSDPLDRDGRVARGWTRAFSLSFDPFPPGRSWYMRVQRKWELSAAHATQVHAALFGQRGRFAGVHKVDALRLLLAGVGLPFAVARAEGDRDAQNPGGHGITWKGLEEEWVGVNIRKACEVPLARDASWVPPPDEEPSDDDMDDDDDDDDGDEGSSNDGDSAPRGVTVPF